MKSFIAGFLAAISAIGIFSPREGFAQTGPQQEGRNLPVELITSVGLITGSSTAWTADGRFFAVPNGNGVNLWDVRSGRRIRQFKGINSSAQSVAIAPDGKLLAANTNKEIVLWDIESGREQSRITFSDMNLIEPRNVNIASLDAIAFTKDGRRLVFTGTFNTGPFPLPGTVYYSGGMVDVATRKGISKSVGVEGRSIDVAPNGKLFAIGQRGGDVQLLSPADGKIVRTLPNPGRRGTDPASAVAFSPDSKLVAVSIVNGDAVQIWNAETGTSVASVPLPDQKEAKVYETSGVAWSPDGRRLATFTRASLRIWNSATWSLAKGLEVPKRPSNPGVRYAQDGKSIFVYSGVDVLRLDADTFTPFESLSSPFIVANPLRGQNAKDDDVLLVANPSKCVIVNLDTRSGNSRYYYRGGEPCSDYGGGISLDGKKLLNISKPALIATDLEAGRRRDIRPASGKLPQAALSADGKTIALVQQSGDKNYSIDIIDEGTGATLRQISVATKAYMLQPVLSHDGKRLVVLARGDTKVWLWDTASGRQLASNDFPSGTRMPASAIVSPDGKSILYLETGLMTYGFEQRSIDGLKLIRKYGLENTEYAHGAGAFHPDGRQVAIGGSDGLIRLWDLNSGKVLQVFKGNTSTIDRVLFKSNGERIVSANWSDGMKIWNTATGDLLVTQYITLAGDWLRITPEGFFDASDNGAKLLTAVRGFESFSIDQLYQSLYRPDLVREKLAGDPRGLVRTAAASLDLNKVIASGNAPEVRVTLPGRGTGAADATSVSAQADISDTGGGIGRIEWRVNGVTAGIDTAVSGAVSPLRVSRNLALDPGDNTIEVVAYNAANLIASVPARIAIAVQAVSLPVTRLPPTPGAAPPAPPPVAAAKPRLFVLVAGVNDYADQRFKLAYAVSDAKEVARGFKEASVGLYESVEVKLMTDRDVTRDRLDAAFAEMAGKTAASDVFVLYLAGHGKTVDGRYHFIPQDFAVQGELTDKAINDAVKTKAIAQDQWQRWFASVPARKSVILFDTCDSGTLAGDETQQLERTAANDRLVQATGRSILAASGGNEAALEGYRGHGLFTYQLLDSINQADGDRSGTIELNELAAYVYGQVAELSQKVFKQRQVPQMRITGNYPLAKQVRILQDETVPVAEAKPAYQVSAATELQIQPGLGATVVRSLSAKTAVTVIESKDGWSLVASEGKPIGYVPTRDLAPAQ